MTVAKENYGFPREWREIYVDERVRTSSVMTDFHAHDYYELSIILSGDISVISGTATSVGTRPRVVLTRPNIPHIMTCNAGIEYRRVNVFFSEEFADTLPERDRLLLMFPIGGGVMELESEAALRIADAARRISDEPDSFRRLLLLAYLLSLIASERRIGADESIPDHVTAALNYVNKSYKSHLTAQVIAKEVGVSRTTLLTSFKRFTGQTLGDYITKYRLYAAFRMLREGATEYSAALACGFGEASSFIRSFRKSFGTTPKKYLSSLN